MLAKSVLSCEQMWMNLQKIFFYVVVHKSYSGLPLLFHTTLKILSSSAPGRMACSTQSCTTPKAQNFWKLSCTRAWRTFFFRAQAGLHGFQHSQPHFFRSGKAGFCQIGCLKPRLNFAQKTAKCHYCLKFEQPAEHFPISEKQQHCFLPLATKNTLACRSVIVWYFERSPKRISRRLRCIQDSLFYNYY